MKIDEFDYLLPKELIAQHPMKDRDKCRLMVLNRKTGSIEHKSFYNIVDYLNKGDTLVLNDSKVIPARIFGKKAETGAKIEFLLIKNMGNDQWETMVRPGKKLKIGDRVIFSSEKGTSLEAEIKDFGPDGTRIVEFSYEGVFMEILEELGSMPLPPYIQRLGDERDKQEYQTVYCREEGSVAAPTAGLHFTEPLLKEISLKGINLAYITLHVGIGTFRPVKCDNIEEHHMHFEEYHIEPEVADLINETKNRGNRVISVGTTSSRTLESSVVYDCKADKWKVKAGSGNTDIFIYPGYDFKIVDSLITNFHLPKSTLLMLISALYDRESILKAYAEAVKEKYRFFSYGDAMLIY